MKDPTDTRDIGPRLGSPLWIYLTSVIVVGAVIFGLAMSQRTGVESLIRHPVFWVLAAMIVLGDIWPIVTPGKSSSEAPHASVAFSFAALIAWGLPVALLLKVSSTILSSLGKRTAPHRTAFNAAASTLGMAAAWPVLYALGDRPMPAKPRVHHTYWVPHAYQVWGILAAGAAWVIVVYVLVGVAIALHSRGPVSPTLLRHLPSQAL